LPDFNQVQVVSTDFHKIFQYQISRASFQWELHDTCGETDSRTEGESGRETDGHTDGRMNGSTKCLTIF